MKTWFLSLEERERLLVVVAGIFLLIAVFYMAVWLPLDRGQRDLNSSIDNWQDSLAELRVLKASARTTPQASAAPRDLNESLVVVVDNTLRQRALYNSLQRSQPTADNGIRDEFENASFDGLVMWLGDLGSAYGLQVQTATFSAASRERDGRVNASLTLVR
ncbi:MAG: type II secretion system protein M [Woeseia sp.]